MSTCVVQVWQQMDIHNLVDKDPVKVLLGFVYKCAGTRLMLESTEGLCRTQTGGFTHFWLDNLAPKCLLKSDGVLI